jgi:hypothetical protein
MSERTEFVGRTPTEWRFIRDAISQWYTIALIEGQEYDNIDDALDLIEEIDRRFDSQR